MSTTPLQGLLSGLTVLINDMTTAREDLVLLTSWMAEDGRYTPADVAYAVEKPYKYEHELAQAKVDVAKGVIA